MNHLKHIKAGLVYVVRSHETGLYKIGATQFRCAYKRIIRLFGLHGEVTLEWVIATNSLFRLETALHMRWPDLRHHGEWYSLSDEHLSQLKTVTSVQYKDRLPIKERDLSEAMGRLDGSYGEVVVIVGEPVRYRNGMHRPAGTAERIRRLINSQTV